MKRAARSRLFTPNARQETTLALHIPHVIPLYCWLFLQEYCVAVHPSSECRSFLFAHVSFSRMGWCPISRCDLCCASSCWVSLRSAPVGLIWYPGKEGAASPTPGKCSLMAMNEVKRPSGTAHSCTKILLMSWLLTSCWPKRSHDQSQHQGGRGRCSF